MSVIAAYSPMGIAARDTGTFAMAEGSRLGRAVRSLLMYDPLPLPNDGKCPHCGHNHGPHMGFFQCVSCGKIVADNDVARRWSTMSWLDWLRVGALTVIGVAALIAISLLIDRTFGGELGYLSQGRGR